MWPYDSTNRSRSRLEVAGNTGSGRLRPGQPAIGLLTHQWPVDLEVLFQSLAIKIAFIGADLVSLHVKYRGTFEGECLPLTGSFYQPVVRNQTGFEFSAVEQFYRKVGNRLPDS